MTSLTEELGVRGLLEFEECQRLVKKFFEGDEEKTKLWWHSKNPMLGNIKPIDMIKCGRTGKLLRWIRQQVEDHTLSKVLQK